MKPPSQAVPEKELQVFRALQQHLNTMPVGYPAVKSGSDLKILKALFTPEEARVALCLDYQFRSLADIHPKCGAAGVNPGSLEKSLDAMVGKNIFCTERNGQKTYALVPFITGFFEMQLKHLTPELVKDAVDFIGRGFALEYLTTKVPQMRIIPVEQAIQPAHAIATYDELRTLIEGANRIAVAECVCKKAGDVSHKPCTRTQRREVCLYFREYAETFLREKWAREISKEEALAIARESEKEGLILQPTNEQNPQAICACCSCCCGIINMLKIFPKPAKLVASNYYAEVVEGACKGCGACAKRCHFDAIQVEDGVARVDRDRCIGCGVCIPACKPEAIHLVKKTKATVPPSTTENLYDSIMQHKSGTWAKIKMVLKQNPVKLIRNLKKASASKAE